jgi:hypothetical protein
VGGYAYIGRGLGEHFEIGILPCGYFASSEPYPEAMGAFYVPIKFDPWPYDDIIHVVIYAGPGLCTSTNGVLPQELGTCGIAGLGFHGYPGDSTEFYTVPSIVFTPEFITNSTDLRFNDAPVIDH